MQMVSLYSGIYIYIIYEKKNYKKKDRRETALPELRSINSAPYLLKVDTSAICMCALASPSFICILTTVRSTFNDVALPFTHRIALHITCRPK